MCVSTLVSFKVVDSMDIPAFFKEDYNYYVFLVDMDERMQGLNYLHVTTIPKLVKDKLNSPVICIKDHNIPTN